MFHQHAMQAVKFPGHHSQCPLCASYDNQYGWMTDFRGMTSQIMKANFVYEGVLHESALSYCPTCDFGYFFPAPSGEILGALYSIWAGASGSDADMLALVDSFTSRQDMHTIFCYMRDSGVVPETFSGQKVLEIGGGYSSFVPRALELGMQVTAIDPGEATASFTERHYGVPAVRCMLDQTPATLNEQFAMVYAKDSLEHHAQPAQSLQRMLDLLRPEGWLVLSVPNLHSRSFQLSSISHPYYAFPQHLNYFSCNAFRNHFKQLGLTRVHATSTTFLSEATRCQDACIKLGLMVPDEPSLNDMAQREQLERIVVLAQKPA
jgi:SAM-dependent methyltransferase